MRLVADTTVKWVCDCCGEARTPMVTFEVQGNFQEIDAIICEDCLTAGLSLIQDRASTPEVIGIGNHNQRQGR